MKVWINDALVDAEEAKVSFFDHGLTVGDAAFETIAVRSGRAVACRRHLDRLRRSAVAMGLPPPEVERLRTAVADTIAANDLGEAVVRVVYTSGPGPLGSVRGERRPTAAVLAGPAPGWAAVADVVVVPWARNERSATAGIKTTSYAENVIALTEARSRGGSEAVFANTAGNLCEGSGSNVFLVLDGILVTPPLSAGCLAGVSRALVIERSGVAVEERDVRVGALGRATEAFLTSATRDVQPVRSVDGVELPYCPGPVTVEVGRAYAALLEADPDPA
ncbi:MAG TPA: aminotransferase class IV [Acidimicrobiales bacterium]|nr:aminotransferase class IV [Acidimicrobiales bacterium]